MLIYLILVSKKISSVFYSYCTHVIKYFTCYCQIEIFCYLSFYNVQIVKHLIIIVNVIGKINLVKGKYGYKS